MAWLYVVVAAIVEVFWVIGLKYSDSILEWLATIAIIIFSFYCIMKASEKIPVGTVYAVFTGSGAAAIVLVDFLVFGAEFSILKVLLIGLIIVGVIGIKLTTENEGTSSQNATEKEGGK